MPATRTRRRAIYIRHIQDQDGDLILHFVDPIRCPRGTFLSSSPVVGIRRVLSAVLDTQDDQSLSRYLVSTENSDYEVEMRRSEAVDLAAALRSKVVAG